MKNASLLQKIVAQKIETLVDPILECYPAYILEPVCTLSTISVTQFKVHVFLQQCMTLCPLQHRSTMGET